MLGLTKLKIIITNSKKIQKIKKSAHIVFLWHILTITVDRGGIDILKHKFDVSKVISQTLSYEVKGEEEWLWL
jgi:hypothetical protein